MIGTRIGAFQLTAKLGEGGMGEVFVAEHAVLDTRRVIKVLLPELTRNAVVVQRFINEARAAASIQHRNIIAVHDVGQLAECGSWYIVMDHLGGGTLRAFLDAHAGPVPAPVALEIVAQIANGLAAAHARGIIHRDLKPDNILLTQRDRHERHVVILDFGIAKLDEQVAGSLTVTGQAIGTPAYMPPEQLRGGKVDATCDVFALGVIAYQLITGGALPYQDEPCLPMAEIYHRQLTSEPTDPRQRVASVPDGWASAILAALARDPAQRPQTPGALALALAEATPDGPALVRAHAPELYDRTPPPRTSAVTIAIGHPPSTIGAAACESLVRAAPPRPRPLWPLLVATALVTSVVTLFVMLRAGDAGAPRAVAPPPVVPVPAPAPVVIADAMPAPPPAPAEPTPVPVPEPVRAKPKPRPVAPGTLVVKVSPWATVTVDRRAYGQTPLETSVPAGPHRVRIANDAIGRTETIDVTVAPGKGVTIERTWTP